MQRRPTERPETPTTPTTLEDRPAIGAILDAAVAAAGNRQGCRSRAQAGVANARKPRRDPTRKSRILNAAAELIAQHGYHAVALADIGEAAGIVGSGIYRHFESKAAILVALFEQVMHRLGQAATTIVHSVSNKHATVTALVLDYIDVAVNDRAIMHIYHMEAHNLAESERRWLRRAQRAYIDGWSTAVGQLRPELVDSEVRMLVHAAIGAVQSTLFHDSGLTAARLTRILQDTAHSCLGVEAHEPR